MQLDEEELDIYRRAAELQEYFAQEQNEATFLCGRRSGKTTLIGALIALYEAYRYHKVPAGEHAYVVLIAPFKKQAKEAFKAIKKYINRSPTLKKSVAKFRTEEIELKNGVIIASWTCSRVSVRGSSIICAICDEIAFWQHEDSGANPEEEVMEVLRPAMATLTNTKLIRISTPFRKERILWNEFQRRHELDHLVWRLSTAEMNPAVPADFLEKERQRSEENYLREYEAQFTDHVESWIGSSTLENCVQRGWTEFPPHQNVSYVAAIDPAFKRDDFALVIAERTAEGNIIIARAITWTGTQSEPLAFDYVCRQIAAILKIYKINSLIGDQHCAVVIQQKFSELDIIYNEFNISADSKLKIFTNLKHLLMNRNLQLLDDPKLLSQFRNLREHRMPNGNVEIRSGGHKDDLVFAAALATYRLTDKFIDMRMLEQLAPQLGIVQSGGYMKEPETCDLQSNCRNFPCCLDRGVCQSYVSLGLTDPKPPSSQVKVGNSGGSNGKPGSLVPVAASMLKRK